MSIALMQRTVPSQFETRWLNETAFEIVNRRGRAIAKVSEDTWDHKVGIEKPCGNLGAVKRVWTGWSKNWDPRDWGSVLYRA